MKLNFIFNLIQSKCKIYIFYILKRIFQIKGIPLTIL